MLVSGICQKILVERLDKFPEPLTGEGYLSSLETSIFWQIPLTSMVYFYNSTEYVVCSGIQWPPPSTLNIFYCWIYSPTKVKYHLTCFNNTFSNNKLISNRFAVFVTCSHILTYMWNRLLIDFYWCVYDRVCNVPLVP